MSWLKVKPSLDVESLVLRSPAMRPASHQAAPVTAAQVRLLLAYLLGRNKQLKPFVVVFKIKNRETCIRKDSEKSCGFSSVRPGQSHGCS